MINTSELKTELEFYKSMYEEYNSQLEKIPEGNICFKKEHGKKRAYMYKDGKYTYLSCEKMDFINRLIERKCIIESMRYIENNIDVLNEALSKYTNFEVLQPGNIRERLSLSLEEPYRKMNNEFKLDATNKTYAKDIDDWLSLPRKENPYKPENKIHITPGGVRVRSKAELIIATYMESMSIPYKYEEQVILNNEIVYPDFMIKRVSDDLIIIWEYFGMMDDEQYRSRTEHKIFLYEKNGYLPYKNFIATYGSKGSSVSMIQLEKIAKLMLI